MSRRSLPATESPNSPSDPRRRRVSRRPFRRVPPAYRVLALSILAVPLPSAAEAGPWSATPSSTVHAACAQASPVDLGAGPVTLRRPTPAAPLHCVRTRPGHGLLLAEALRTGDSAGAARASLDPADLRIAVLDESCRPAPERVLDQTLPWVLVEIGDEPVHVCVGSRVPNLPAGPHSLRLAAARPGGPHAPAAAGSARERAFPKTDGDSTSDPIEPDPEGIGVELGLCAPGRSADGSPDDHADGIACASPLEAGRAVPGRLGGEGDADLFRFELTAETTVFLQAVDRVAAHRKGVHTETKPGLSSGVRLLLLDAEGRPVGSPGQVHSRILPAGIWHLRVDSAGSTGGPPTDAYRLLLSLAEPAW